MNNFWNERYSQSEYVYGEKPNEFFADELKKLAPGIIILPCEGEGRNAVFAASLGWGVLAFDSSEEGKSKALQLANKRNVKFEYQIADAVNVVYVAESADVVALIYAHLPASVRGKLYKKAVKWLKPGGRIILEAFNPDQLANSSGGPKELSMLISLETLKEDFEQLHTEVSFTLQTELAEGEFHKGKANIVRYIGIKK